MEIDPTTPARLPLKRVHDDAHSGESPVQLSLKPALEPDSGDDNLPQPAPSRSLAKSTPRSQLPQVFTTPYSTSLTTEVPVMEDTKTPFPLNSEANDESSEDDITKVPASLQAEWEADPVAEVIDMSKITDTEPRAAAPAHKQWSLIKTSADRPDLNHHSDNPFDFLSAAKLGKLVGFWHGNQEASSKLSRVERACFGETRMKKILAKIVCQGAAPMDNERRIAWIRSAVHSAIAPKRGADGRPGIRQISAVRD